MSRGGARKGAGRPLLPSEEKRTEQLRIRVTPGERAALEDAAARLAPGLTIQAWLRQLALRHTDE